MALFLLSLFFAFSCTTTAFIYYLNYKSRIDREALSRAIIKTSLYFKLATKEGKEKRKEKLNEKK